MAISKITWENKEGIQNDTSIARKNKVMDDDMNEIKQVVNNNADELNIAQSNIEDLQSGQSTSNADITNIKNRISTLETDNKTNKSDISALKSDNTTNKENISTLQEQVSNKVDKVEGKGLSTNDFTNEYKQKLEDLENYDDTEVKKDISDIKEEQETQNTNIENLQEKDTTQDELIEKLQQENENIKSALINVETEQSKSIHVEDASTVAGKLEVEGNAEQETQEGTDNLAILENKTYTQNGITIDVKNGEASISGTATVDTTIRIGTAYLVSGKTYYVRKTTNGGGYYLQGTSGAQKWIGDGESSFNPSTTGEWGIYASFATNDNANTKVKFVVSEQSGTAWVEGKVQIPSPINPSKVKCLGSNKNYFNKDTVTQNKYLSYQNEEIENNSWTYTDYIECKPNEDWIISGYTTIGGAPSRCFYDANKNLVGGRAHNNQESMMKFTTPANCYYFRDSIAKADIDTVKIEKGDTATSYSPYGQGSTEIKKYNKNLYKPVASSGSTNGISYTIDNNGVVTLNGQSTANADIYIIKSDFNNQITNIKLKTVTTQVANSELSLYVGLGHGTFAKDTFTLKEKQYIASSFIRVPSGITCNNLTVYPQIEEGSVATDYEEHREDNYILPIQQEMLNGDYFELEEDGWKEVHGWNKLTFIGNENFNKSGSATDEVFVATLDIDDGIEGKGYSNYFKYSSKIAIGNFLVYNNGSNIRFCVDGTEITTIEQFKVLLQQKNSEGNPLYVFYKLATPTKLACTEEQSAVLDKLNNLGLFDGTNNIITTEDIALLKLNYVADTKTYIDNKYNNLANQILEIVGGN